MNEGWGFANDVLTGHRAKQEDDQPVTAAMWATSLPGFYNNIAAAYPQYWQTQLIGGDYDNVTTASIAVRLRYTATSANDQLFAGKSNGPILYLLASTDEMAISRQTSLAIPFAISTSITANQWYSVVGTVGGVGTLPSLYIDGIRNESSSSGGSGTVSDDSGADWRVGSVLGASRDVAYVYVWRNRILTPNEAMQLHMDPYAFFTPLHRRAMHKAAAVGGVTAFAGLIGGGLGGKQRVIG